MADYLFGPAGWSYADWKDTVYADLAEDNGINRLKFIASRFDFVELNTSFYHVPAPNLVSIWAKTKSEFPEFFFWVKGWQKFSHLHKDQKRDHLLFQDFLNKMSRQNLIKGIIWQFPYSFGFSEENFSYLQNLTSDYQDFLQAVEFRKRDWLKEQTLDYFKKKGLVWVNIDQPQISQNLALTAIVTSNDFSYFRFHGRNRSSWFSGEGRDQRYNYEYNQNELIGLAAAIKSITAGKVFIVFNNHYRGSAVRNLEALQKILQSEN